MVAHLRGIGTNIAVVQADKDMIEFEFREAVVEFRPVSELEQLTKPGGEPQLLAKSADSRIMRVLAGSGMTTAGICPKPRTMVFAFGPALQEHLTLRVEDKNAKSPVEKGFTMGFQFFHGA